MPDNVISFPGSGGAEPSDELAFERQVQRNFSEAAKEMRRTDLAQKLAQHGIPNPALLREQEMPTTDTKPLQ